MAGFAWCMLELDAWREIDNEDVATRLKRRMRLLKQQNTLLGRSVMERYGLDWPTKSLYKIRKMRTKQEDIHLKVKHLDDQKKDNQKGNLDVQKKDNQKGNLDGQKKDNQKGNLDGKKKGNLDDQKKGKQKGNLDGKKKGNLDGQKKGNFDGQKKGNLDDQKKGTQKGKLGGQKKRNTGKQNDMKTNREQLLEAQLLLQQRILEYQHQQIVIFQQLHFFPHPPGL